MLSFVLLRGSGARPAVAIVRATTRGHKSARERSGLLSTARHRHLTANSLGRCGDFRALRAGALPSDVGSGRPAFAEPAA
jgi:hypothetical protein